MISRDNDIAQFARLLDALGPWLGRVVFIGGWAHRLYRERQEATSLPYPPLRTDDADVALDPRGLGPGGDLRERLIASGFTERLSGEDRPPVTRYALGEEAGGFYAEFLTPLLGGDRRRDGRRDLTERVGGVIAQKLRHLDVLLVAPWSVTVSERSGFPLNHATVLRVPNPVTFIVQKLLIHGQRTREDRAKDVLYVHDTIELFGGTLDDMNIIWRASVAPALSPSARSRFRRAVGLFDTTGDTIREASIMATPRVLTPQMVQELCQVGLARVVGE